MTADVIALRAHLVAEVEQAIDEALTLQDVARVKSANTRACIGRAYTPFSLDSQYSDDWAYEHARTATDAWLTADARLRALDGLLAASKAQADAVELRRTGTFARGRWYTREEIDALMLAPCEGDTCAWRECLPCGLRRLGAADRPWHDHRSWPPTRAT